MKKLRPIIVGTFALLAPTAAWAGMAQGTPDAQPHTAWQHPGDQLVAAPAPIISTARPTAQLQDWHAALAAEQLWHDVHNSGGARFAVPQLEETASGCAAVRPITLELPPPPNSTTLAFSGLLSAAAFHLLRNARRMHVGGVPDWYHSGGPMRVGAAVPYDLEFPSSPPAYATIRAGVSRATPAVSIRNEQCARVVLRFISISEAPRGPPRQA